MKPELSRYLGSRCALVETALRRLLDPKAGEPAELRRAMSYSLFAGGKRLRPILVMAAAESCGVPARRVLKAAAALEMIHTYSLIHDDLPAMDDDDLRRGKPTNHKVFGEALAILAGDGLLTQAFEAAAENASARGLSAREATALIRAIARGAGSRGMVGGQAADLSAQGWSEKGHGGNGSKRKLGKRLEYIHRNKTAALIAASLEAGAILARGSTAQRRRLRAYGLAVGLAFQIADDILDVAGDKKKLGKIGSDRKNRKLTYAALYGLKKARAKAKTLVAQAHRRLAGLGPRARVLHDLADYVVLREN